jgi:prepilin-type processing-associated H-X9-DG protein
MACVWNPPIAYIPGSGFKIFKKLSDARNPGMRHVFVDNVGVDYDAMFTVPYDIPEWRNIPNWRHSNGTTVSFGDGHVEYWRWTNRDLTVEVAKRSYELAMLNKTISRMVDQGDQSNNEDLKRIQRATWGTIGY